MCADIIGKCPKCSENIKLEDMRKIHVAGGGIYKKTYAFICKKCEHIIGFST